MIKLDALEEIRTLKASAAAMGGFFQRYEDKIVSDPNYDKCGARFEPTSDRFCSFSLKIMFSAYAGQYGNSACSTLSLGTPAIAEKYVTQAMNAMAKAIFAKASELMLADAAALQSKAVEEIAALQQLVAEVSAEPQPEAA